MVEEYSIPPPEGPVPKKPSRFRRFQEHESPIEIGSLEKEALSYVGEWNLVMRTDGYGVAYRLAMKKDIYDDEGDPNTLCFFFGLPIAKKGLQITPEITQNLMQSLHHVMELFTIQAHEMYGNNVMSVSPETPSWMIRELEELVK